MTPDELRTRCTESGIEWAERDHDGRPGFFLRIPELDQGNGDDTVTHVALDALPNLDWQTVKRHAIAGRDVSHFTRIVGYLSRVDNWNASKIGELHDRHKGRYSVPAAE